MTKKLVQQKFIATFEISTVIQEITETQGEDAWAQKQLQAVLVNNPEALEIFLKSRVKNALYNFVEPFSSNTDPDYVREEQAISWAFRQLDGEARRFFEEAEANGYLSEVTQLIWYDNAHTSIDHFRIADLLEGNRDVS